MAAAQGLARRCAETRGQLLFVRELAGAIRGHRCTEGSAGLGRDHASGIRSATRRCSSSASGLPSRNSARILGIRASFQRDNLRRHFGVRVLHAQPGSPVSVDHVWFAGIRATFPTVSDAGDRLHISREHSRIIASAVFDVLRRANVLLIDQPGQSNPETA